jgi:choice-of-anchor A domain-containing protein
MLKASSLIAFSFIFSILALSNPLKADINSDPWQLNVYTISGMGSASSAYSGASVQGAIGSGGNVYLNGMGLNTAGGGLTYAAYTAGDLTFNSSSSYQSGISVGGNLNYNQSTVVGNVQSGGNLTGTTGQIQGNVTLHGTNQASSGLVISGTVSQNQTVNNPLNASTVNNYFQSASSFWAGLSPTATVNNVYGQLVVSGLQAGRNVVNLSLSSLNSAWGIQLSGPSNAFVVFNITDATGTLNAVTFNFSGGIGLNNVLFNLPNSTTLTMNGGGTYASVLAPLSTVTFGNGQLQGTFVSNTLLGSGSFQTGAFTGYAADQSHFAVLAPEPPTYLILTSFLVGALYLGRKRLAAKSS